MFENNNTAYNTTDGNNNVLSPLRADPGSVGHVFGYSFTILTIFILKTLRIIWLFLNNMYTPTGAAKCQLKIPIAPDALVPMRLRFESP